MWLFYALILFIFSINNFQAQDTDGDGITNTVDLDDDNDGILDTLECNSIERVTGSSFDNNGNNIQTSTVIGWTLTGGSVWSDSNNFIQFDQDNSTKTLTQTVSSIAWSEDSPVINMEWMARNNTANITTSGIIATIAYAGVIYATITTANNNGAATLVANNGAVLIGGIPTYNSGGSAPSFINQSLTLPNTVPGSGIFTITYTSTNVNDDELNLNLFSIQSCRDLDNDGIPDYLDSDNDGCVDAIEGGANILSSQLVAASGTLSVGTGSTASNQNLGNTIDSNGVPTIVSGGQSLGDSGNVSVNSCFCYKPATTTDTDKAMILPKTTYSAIVNPAAGMMIYDTTAKQLAVFNGTVWSFWKP